MSIATSAAVGLMNYFGLHLLITLRKELQLQTGEILLHGSVSLCSPPAAGCYCWDFLSLSFGNSSFSWRSFSGEGHHSQDCPCWKTPGFGEQNVPLVCWGETSAGRGTGERIQTKLSQKRQNLIINPFSYSAFSFCLRTTRPLQRTAWKICCFLFFLCSSQISPFHSKNPTSPGEFSL